MELSNALQHAGGPSRADGVRTLLLLLAPITPHITEELWERRHGGMGSIHRQSWPTYDPSLVAEREITLVLQVDGRVRDRITVPAGLSEDESREAALRSERVRAHLDGRRVARPPIVVPDRLVNVVTSPR